MKELLPLDQQQETITVPEHAILDALRLALIDQNLINPSQNHERNPNQKCCN